MPPSQAHTASSHPFGDGISLFGLSLTEANLITALYMVGDGRSAGNHLHEILLTLAEHLALAQIGGREGGAGIGDLLAVEGHAALLDGLTG